MRVHTRSSVCGSFFFLRVVAGTPPCAFCSKNYLWVRVGADDLLAREALGHRPPWLHYEGASRGHTEGGGGVNYQHLLLLYVYYTFRVGRARTIMNAELPSKSALSLVKLSSGDGLHKMGKSSPTTQQHTARYPAHLFRALLCLRWNFVSSDKPSISFFDPRFVKSSSSCQRIEQGMATSTMSGDTPSIRNNKERER